MWLGLCGTIGMHHLWRSNFSLFILASCTSGMIDTFKSATSSSNQSVSAELRQWKPPENGFF